MKSTKILIILVLAVSLIVCLAKVSESVEMGTTFTYQGRLIDANSVADGLYDFQFKLFDDPNNIIGNQIGSDFNVPDMDVIDGYFTVLLDFGSSVFDGNAIWLEIGIRDYDPCDVNAFTALSPRQEVTPTPYALYAMQSRGIFVDEEGNVGIGTATPSERLEVAGNSTITGDLTLSGDLDMGGNAITNMATVNGLPSVQLTHLTNVTSDIQVQLDSVAALDLDSAYDNGRTITVNAGSVQLNDSQTSGANNAFYVNSTGVVGGAADRTVVSIENNAAHTTTGEITALNVDMGGDYSAGYGDATGINVDLYGVTNAGNKTGIYVRMRNQTEMGIRTNGSFQVDGSTTLGSAASDTVTINAGPVNLPNATSASDALVFGSTGSANLYRSATDTLKTDDSLVVTGTINADDDLKVIGAYKGNISSSSGSDGAPFPRPAYDSGWQSISKGSTIALTHNIGGNVDNYVVDVQFKAKGSAGINNWGYGSLETGGMFYGAYWHDLTTASISVSRQASDTAADAVRVRIWVYN